MDDAVYRQLLSKLKKSALPHHNIPNHNLLSVEELFEVSEDLNIETFDHEPKFLSSFPCYHKFPFSIYKNFPLFPGSGHKDDASWLVKEKIKWQKELKNLKLPDINKATEKLQALKQNETVGVSKNLKRLINHFRDDPEPMFYGSYNWLYTGGSLDYFEDYSGVTLITGDIIKEKPGFNLLKLNESSQEIQHKTSCTLKSHSPVFQITCRSSQDNFLACIRQKNYLSVFNIKAGASSNNASEPCAKLWRKKMHPPKLMVCSDVKPDCEEIIISDSNQDIHAFRIDPKSKVYACTGRRICRDSQRDPWSQVSFGDYGLYVAFRNCFVVLDPRDVNSEIAFQYTPSASLLNCEEICSFVRSPNDANVLYLGTTHSLLQLDLRSGEPIQKWTHLMKKPPQFLTNTDEDGSELLILQSQDVSEILGVVNEYTKEEDKIRFISLSLPCALRSVNDSLKAAQFQGVCLSPFISERINFTVTGLKCFKDNSGDINIFTKNSAGDVFLSKMRKTIGLSNDEDPEALNAMKAYASHVQGSPVKPLSSRLEMKNMAHVLEDVNNPELKMKKTGTGEAYWRWQEMYSPESLVFCRDFLAQKILRVWGYNEENPDEDKKEYSVDDKVLEWMSRN